MTRLLVPTLVSILTLTSIASGQGGPGIIPIGSSIKFGGTNAPDTYSDASTFGPTPVLVDGGRVRIWQEQVPSGTNGEWNIFHMRTADGGPVAGNLNANWAIVVEYNLRAPAVFDGTAYQFSVDGQPVSSIANFGSVCCATLTNPILPGPAFYNPGSNGVLPAGVQSNWQQIFINPYSFASSGGIPINSANGFTFALHFTLRPSAPPSVSSLISAGAFGAFPAFAPGSWIEIYGANFAAGTQNWSTGDFQGGVAPSRLGGVTVTIGGRPAFINYVSPTQVNVQVPSGVGLGPQSVVLTNAMGSSSFTATVESVRPGLLAPAGFRLAGVQHVTALFPDNVTYVLPPGAIAGVPSRRARPGDTIILYGIGFGPVTPNIAPGQLSQQLNALNTPVSIRIGGVPAVLTYAGLAPNFVGLYQFNVVVPAIAPGDAVPVAFTQGGLSSSQNLAIAVGN